MHRISSSDKGEHDWYVARTAAELQPSRLVSHRHWHVPIEVGAVHAGKAAYKGCATQPLRGPRSKRSGPGNTTHEPPRKHNTAAQNRAVPHAPAPCSTLAGTCGTQPQGPQTGLGIKPPQQQPRLQQSMLAKAASAQLGQ